MRNLLTYSLHSRIWREFSRYCGGKLKVFDLAFVVDDFVEAVRVSFGGLEFNKITIVRKYSIYGAKLPFYFARSFRRRFV